MNTFSTSDKMKTLDNILNEQVIVYLQERKRAVSRLEEDVASTKALYSQALRSLEAISDDIHRQRLERRQKLELGVRGAGVGAESPSPPPWEKGKVLMKFINQQLRF